MDPLCECPQDYRKCSDCKYVEGKRVYLDREANTCREVRAPSVLRRSLLLLLLLGPTAHQAGAAWAPFLAVRRGLQPV